MQVTSVTPEMLFWTTNRTEYMKLKQKLKLWEERDYDEHLPQM